MKPCERCDACRWLKWDSRREWCSHPCAETDSSGTAVECLSFEPARSERWGYVMRSNEGVDPRPC